MKAPTKQAFPALAALAFLLPLGWLSRPAAGTADSVSPAAPAGAYTVDGAHSWVVFRTNHLGIGMAYGSFAKLSGSLNYDPADPAKNNIQMVIDADSIQTNNEGRDKHLRSPDFFNVKEFPEIKFASSAVKAAADGNWEMTGTLDLHGVQKEITAKVKKIGEGKGPRGDERAGFEATFTVNRLDYGMNYMPEGLGPEVEVVVSLEAVKK